MSRIMGNDGRALQYISHNKSRLCLRNLTPFGYSLYMRTRKLYQYVRIVLDSLFGDMDDFYWCELRTRVLVRIR